MLYYANTLEDPLKDRVSTNRVKFATSLEQINGQRLPAMYPGAITAEPVYTTATNIDGTKEYTFTDALCRALSTMISMKNVGLMTPEQQALWDEYVRAGGLATIGDSTDLSKLDSEVLRQLDEALGLYLEKEKDD